MPLNLKKLIIALLTAVIAVGPPAAGLAHAAKKPPPPNISNLWFDYATRAKPRFPEKQFPFQDCFEDAAINTRLPLTLLLAVARGESDFDPETISKANARGVMQILWPGTAMDLGFKSVEELHQPCPNIRAGSKYLRGLVDRYSGDLHLALAAYNYGPGRIKTAATMPDGAKWYSGYIYNHLLFVLGKASRPSEPAYDNTRRIVLTHFSRPYQAEGYVEFLRSEFSEFQFDWFRSSENPGDFDAVLIYVDNASRSKAEKLLRDAGLLR